MSWQLMRDVLEHSKAKDTTRTIAAIFAFYTDKDSDLSYVGNDRVVAEWGLSLSTVQRGLRELQELGEFQRQRHLESGNRRRVFLIDPTFRRQSSLFDDENPVSRLGVTEGVTRQLGVTEGVTLVRARPKEPVDKGTTPLGPPGGGAASAVLASRSATAAPGAAVARRRRRRRRAANSDAHFVASEPCPRQSGGQEDPAASASWQHIAQRLRAVVGDQQFGVWFADAHPHRLDQDVLVLGVTAGKVTWSTSRFAPVFEKLGVSVELVGCTALGAQR